MPQTLLDDPLTGLRLTLVGAGRVGGSLIRWARARGAEPVRIAGRAATGGGRDLAGELEVPWVGIEDLCSDDADLLLLAVTDEALPTLAAELARRPQAPVVLHCAGALGAEILTPLATAGSACGTLHPLLAFPAMLPTPPAGGVFAVAGSPRARALGERLARAFDGRPVHVPDEARARYHLAASMAAGGVATVLAAAFELIDGLDDAEAVRAGYLRLARGVLDEIERRDDAATAITGPAARGEADVVRRQLALLAREAPAVGALLRPLLVETARHTASRLDAETNWRMREALTEEIAQPPES